MFRQITIVLGVLLAGWQAVAVEIGDNCSDEEDETYVRTITQAVHAAWAPPYKDRAISCTVLLRQNFRGEVLNVGIANCGDDPRVHKSVIEAGYNASPIPLPANKACFRRDIIIRIETRALEYQ